VIALVTQPTRSGFAFAHWSRTEGGPAVTVGDLVGGDTVLYAQWTADTVDPDVLHTVTFIGNGGTPALQVETVEDDETALGAVIALVTQPTRSGFAFAHWSRTEGGPAVTVGDLVGGDTVLYAQWTAEGTEPGVNYSVQFHGNGGIQTLQTRLVTDDETTYGAVIALVTEPTREGYRFLHWSLEEEGDAADMATVVDGDTIFYAQWALDDTEDTYAVTFFGNGGTPAQQTAMVALDATYYAAFVQVARPIRIGYVFQGWFTAQSGGERVLDTDRVAESEHRELHAQWSLEPSPPDPSDPPNSPNLPDIVVPLTEEHHAYLFGFGDETIRPDQNITRAEVATIFFRLIPDQFRAEKWVTSNDYSDIYGSEWHNNAISTMSNAGLFTGYLDGSFAPNKPITRSEFAAVAARFIESDVDQLSLFSDVSGHWAERYINSIAQFDWVQGFGDGTFRPDDLITRAQVTAIVNRMLDRNIEHADDLLDGMRTWSDNANPEAWYYLYMQAATNAADYERKEDDTYIKWTAVWPPLDFTILERADAEHHHIVSARAVWQQQKQDASSVGG
ncbi:MAG: InlB B-repeat-containing protein, partial [Oscillospiraceae bacterium]|nr:InlB B-repeat-containing protein [Oscillospiraceae bacterium]